MILFQQDCIKEVVEMKSKILHPFVFIAMIFFYIFMTIFVFIRNLLWSKSFLTVKELHKKESGTISLEDIQSDELAKS